MSRKKHTKGTCPSCRSYNVSKQETAELLKLTCADCGFLYTIRASPKPVREQDEKAGQLHFSDLDEWVDGE